MNMNLDHLANMRDLLARPPKGGRVYDGGDGKSLEELLQEGDMVIKPIEGGWLDTTVYYGTELTTVAAVTTAADQLNIVAGIEEAETEAE